MCASKFFTCLFLMVLTVFSVSGQNKSRNTLEREKRESLKKIQDVEKILNETAGQKKSDLGQLYALNSQIKERKKVINSIKGVIYIIELDIRDTDEIIQSLGEDLEQLKEEYATILRASYISSRGHGKITFLFASDSFSDFMLRMKYLEEYSKARKRQADHIEKVQFALKGQIQSIQQKRKDQQLLLEEQIQGNIKLTNLKNKQSAIVKTLEAKEKQLEDEIADYKDAVVQLESTIDNLIKSEMAKAAKAAETASANSGSNSKVTATPEVAKLTGAFSSNKRKLPWPVEKGFVSKGYGVQRHVVLKRVQFENNGIDIQTNEGEKVRAVYSGKVNAVGYAPGMGNFIMVQHGEYFTVYAKLKNVSVKSGQTIDVKDEMGVVMTDKNGVSELHFEIWKKSERMNPQQWLNPR